MKNTGRLFRKMSILVSVTAVLICSCCIHVTETVAVFASETADSPSAQQAVQVSFERSYTDGMEQAAITGLDDSGSVLWSIQTEAYPGTQLPNCSDIGIENGMYYYAEGGRILALDLSNGSTIWENAEFKGSAICHVMDENGIMYVCGYYGPDLFVIDKDGNTISRIDRFRDDYNWPYQIELHEGILTIWYEQNGQSLQIPLADVTGIPSETSDNGAIAETAETDGAPLTPETITASSELEPYTSSIPPYPLYTYYASYIDDGDLSTAWNEGVPGDGTGEYLELAFPEGVTLTGGTILPGFYETEELFFENNAPTSLEISSGGNSCILDLSDSVHTWQAGTAGIPFHLEPTITSNGTVRVTILGTRPGTKYDDTCITELHFYGDAASKNSEPAEREPDSTEENAGFLTESDLQATFSNQISEPVLYFLYDDYDYNGTCEAMVVTQQPDGIHVHVWFVDSNGSITDLTGGHELYGYEFQDSANVRQRYIVDTGTQKFYVWENSAGGSGSLSYVFGVQNNIPYEPAVSGTIQSFQKEGAEYVYYGNDFSKGFHDYPRIVLNYDAANGEFY